METIGSKIRRLRLSKELTQKKLAKIIKVAPVTISKWESDISKPKGESVIRLSDYFDVDVDAFISDSSYIKEIDKILHIPFYSEVVASAGNGTYCDCEDVEYINVNSSFVTNPDSTVAIRVRGNSMQPVFYDGAIIFIDTTIKVVVDGSVYVVLHDDMIRVKVLEETSVGFNLKSYNTGEYPTEKVNIYESNLKIIGKVTAQIQKYD
ncbi:Putative phage repressor [Moritella viscosa]|uniref:XRE family transcriptional regulator n=1 Tax=Moritella viscosa TaxID=80854 RepID=UPI000917052F|nr:XRE family transcriptional regulator [Moritella viscosa]SGZ09188.1 Putative phage repressor [Moritella viscosa]